MTHRFMLDTNVMSALISERGVAVRSRFEQESSANLCISSVTRGEIGFGLAKTPEAARRNATAARLFGIIASLDWTVRTAVAYAELRATMWRAGKALGPLDMLIAAHALEIGATLVTADQAFRHVPSLRVEDWSQS